MRVLLQSNLYPGPRNPNFGVFVRNQVERLGSAHGVTFAKNVSDLRCGTWRDRARKYLTLHRNAWRYRGEEFDVVHLHYASASHLLAASPVLLGRRPYLVTVHRGELADVAPDSAAGRVIAFFLRRARHVIAVSDALAERIVADYGVLASSVSVIDVGCDLARFAPRPASERAALRSERDLAPDRVVLLFVGALIERKGVDVLLDALGRAGAVDRSTTLVIGDGPERDRLQALRRKRCPEHDVRFLGERDHRELPTWFAAADAFVLPSRSEGTPTVLLEAMGAGLPVLASAVGGIPALLRSGGGTTFPADDAGAAADAISRILTSRETRQRWGERALRESRLHGLDRQVARIAELYRASARRA